MQTECWSQCPHPEGGAAAPLLIWFRKSRGVTFHCTLVVEVVTKLPRLKGLGGDIQTLPLDGLNVKELAVKFHNPRRTYHIGLLWRLH